MAPPGMNKPNSTLKNAIMAPLAIVSLSLLVVVLDDALHLESPILQLLANTLPAILLWLGVLALTQRIAVSAILTGALTAGLFAISCAKFANTEQYLVYQDAILASQLVQGWDVFVRYTNLWLLIPGILLLVAIVVLGWRERPVSIFAASALGLLSATGFYSISLDTEQLAPLYSTQAHGGRPWRANSPVEDQGLLASLVVGARNSDFTPPPFDKALIQAFSNNQAASHSPITPAEQPDIILWLGESFFDPGIIAGIDTCKVLPTYCTLVNSGLNSGIDVPTFGGNTVRTEFEVLTAVPFKMLGGKDYPYVTTVLKPFDSIAWTLKKSGYRNIAIHPHDKTFWQRDRALPLLGFDTYLGQNDLKDYEKDGTWIADKFLAKQVMQQLDQAKDPSLIFAISMEGHGPFGRQKNLAAEKLNAIKPLEGVDTNGTRVWREYIYHARNTARALEQLKTYIDQRERPTLIVFFGDHLPGIKPLFKQLKFDNDGSPHQQDNPVLALANYPISSSWLPRFSHEVGLWLLQLSGNTGPGALQQLMRATALAHAPNGEPYRSTVRAMQAKQLQSL